MGKILIRCTKSSTMMTNLVADDFLNEEICVPCLAEQTKIAHFLNSIDTRISVQEKLLLSLVGQKEALLGQVFI